MELENIKNRSGTAYALFQKYKHETGTFIRTQKYSGANPWQNLDKFFDKIMKPLFLSLTNIINKYLTQTRSIGGFSYLKYARIQVH